MKTALTIFTFLLLVGISACNAPIIISPDAALPDGSVYQGEVLDGKFNGQGELVYPDGAYYKGTFKDGSFNGQGKYVTSLGEEYEGEFVSGKLQGKGRAVDLDENQYEGEFVNWLYEGKGKLTQNGSSYEGDFKQGKFHGQGKYTIGEVIYEGQFVEGEIDGQGTYIGYDGSTYTGQIKDWSGNGAGVKVTQEGETITADFEHGYAGGKGQISWADGSLYEGELEYDKPDGEGVFTYADGRIYKGELSYGEQNGIGTLTTPAKDNEPATELTGKWRSGRLVHNYATDEREHAQAELALENHQRLLQQSIEQLLEQSDAASEVYFLGVAGDGSQSVFRRELEFVKPLIETRYGSEGRSINLINHHDTAELYPMATRRSIATAIDAIAQKMDKEDDVLFMYLSSHGSKQHEFYLNHDSIDLPPLGASALADMLDKSNIKWKVIIVSACYAGGFIPELSNENTLIMAAADAESRSFGCSEEADMTYFGKALFTEALTKNPDYSLTEAFDVAKSLVAEWETELEDKSSNPMIHAPKPILTKLAELRLELD